MNRFPHSKQVYGFSLPFCLREDEDEDEVMALLNCEFKSQARRSRFLPLVDSLRNLSSTFNCSTVMVSKLFSLSSHWTILIISYRGKI